MEDPLGGSNYHCQVSGKEVVSLTQSHQDLETKIAPNSVFNKTPVHFKIISECLRLKHMSLSALADPKFEDSDTVDGGLKSHPLDV